MDAQARPPRSDAIDLAGLWVPIITPLTPGGALDHGSLERLGERLVDDGCRGLVALGTTGEPATLSPDERNAVVDVCAAVCARRSTPLMVGVGTNDTRSTIEAACASADRVAPAAVLVVVPYYTRPSEAGVVEHFRAVAAASPVPVVAYNVPYRTGRGLTAATLLEIASIPNVVGLKQSVGSLDHDTLRLLADKPADFQVLAGDDAYITPSVLMGAVGAIAAAGHLRTRRFVEMIDRALAGQVAAARVIAEELLPIIEAGFAEPNPAGWKAALHGIGEITSSAVRLPMVAASAASVERLRQLLDYGVIHA